MYMTNLLQDILHEPEELIKTLENSWYQKRQTLEEAGRMVREAQAVYIVGIGSSWHAGMAVLSIFHAFGYPAILIDASEMVHFTSVPRKSTVIILSRSGRSLEVVQMIEQLKSQLARIIAVTNTTESPLAKEADVCLQVHARFDHLVSITMYAALALAGSLIATVAVGRLDEVLVRTLTESLASTKYAMPLWQEQIETMTWLNRDAPTYFLARGGSLASCHEARLLWEEAAKAPASSLSTGGFRHGPQEMVHEGLRVAMWLHGEKVRTEDLAVAADLRRNGSRVFLIGQGLDINAADLVISLPTIPPRWQFLVDIIPVQIAAERLSRLRGVDCDAFRLCPYIVEHAGGLTA
jgi:glucosamine--fructose-6-phosphate aminotransferase (isomerizing)